MNKKNTNIKTSPKDMISTCPVNAPAIMKAIESQKVAIVIPPLLPQNIITSQ